MPPPATIFHNGSLTLRLEWATHSLTLHAGARLVLRGALALGGARAAPVRGGRADEPLEWPDGTRLCVCTCADGFELHWEGTAQAILEDGFELASGGHWFGGAELVRQHWPLETLRWEMQPFQAWDNGPTGLGGVLHPLWFASSGAAIHADAALPLSVALNAPRTAPPPRAWPMGLSDASPLLFPLPDSDGSGDGLLRLRGGLVEGRARLRYTLTAHPNPAEAQRALLASLPRPRAVPPAALFDAPTWTTWARYKMGIDQRWVLRFADEIVAHDFPRSVMEIDDKWSVAYGDLEFDPVKFPDPRAMVERLHEQGFRVTLWVMPFAVRGSAAFEEGRRQGFWVRGAAGEPGFFRWWQGEGVALDVSNAAAVAWFLERLHSLQRRYAIDGFKFDAGEPCFLPDSFQTAQPLQPNDYTTLWVERVASQFAWAEVRAAYRNQSVPILVREWDRYSSWGLDNGLQSIVTAALTFGALGYPFVLPDMIGGNAYGTLMPDRELMVRWAQANALLPAMQFSIAPWDFDEEVTELCRRAVAWHRAVTPTILRLAEEATRAGQPLVRPLFWLAPDEPESYAIGDQFALGQKIVVAPVMEPGARARDLYLPAGHWRDVLRGDTIEGGRWLREYPAPLDHLPWFERHEGSAP